MLDENFDRVRRAVCAAPVLVAAIAFARADSTVPPTSAAKALGVVDAVERLDPAIKPPKRFALVVGVAQYQDSRIPDLPACERDARDLGALLVDPAIGLFPPANVTSLVDAAATRTAVVAALDDLARKAGPDDLVIVYFSGHGATDEKGRAYWVMSDTAVDRLRSTALPELEISELLGEIRTRRLVTIIDACYSAATASVGSTKSLLDLGRLYPEFKGDGRIGMTASKGDQLSVVITDQSDPGFGHSAFTYHVIEGMRGNADARGNGDGVIELDELWSFVKDRTVETARRQGGNQEPQLKGQLGSRFLLAVDGPRLAALADARKGADRRSEEQLSSLRDVFVQEKLSAARFEEARRLLRAPIESLSDAERERRTIYADLAEGRVALHHLDTLLPERAASTPLAPAPEAEWPAIVASMAPRFTDVEAPMAIALDLDALRGEGTLGRFAEAFGRWKLPEQASSGPGQPRLAVLLCEPFPATSDSTVLLRGMLRRHRGDGALPQILGEASGIDGDRLTIEGTLVQRVAPRTTLALVGGVEDAQRLLARAGDRRPQWSAALDAALRSGMPLALAADGPWSLDRLETFAGGRDGRLFVGGLYASLMLDDSAEIPRLWAEATDGLLTLSATGQPTGPWIRTAIRIDFATDADAERAAPRWRLFLSRLPGWVGADDVRPLDVQRSERSLILRFDLRIEALADWLDQRCALPGSAAAS